MFDLARWRARFAWLDTALSIQERFGAIGGGPLAASLALAGFLSLFPLLLVAIAVIGFLSSGDTGFAARLVEDMGLDGRASELVTDGISSAESSRRTASIVGFAGLLWSGLGVVGTLQAAVNAAWQTTGRGIRDKLVAMAWMAGAGLLFLASSAATPVLRLFPGPVVVLGTVLSLVVTIGVLLWAYSFLGNQPIPWRAHLGGAVLAGVGFEALKAIGAYYLPRMVSSSSALYGTLGVVFAVLAYLLLHARLFVYGAVVNVHRWEAEQGTVTVQVQVPRIDGEVPLEANRGGAVAEAAPTDD